MKTGRDIQRAIFLDSLRQEFDKTSASCRSNELRSAADNYYADGYTDDEIIELLIIDGFDETMAVTCVERLSKFAGSGDSGKSQWGFEFEDGNGSVFSNSDIGITLEAASERDAWEGAEDTLARYGSSASISKVFKL